MRSPSVQVPILSPLSPILLYLLLSSPFISLCLPSSLILFLQFPERAVPVSFRVVCLWYLQSPLSLPPYYTSPSSIGRMQSRGVKRKEQKRYFFYILYLLFHSYLVDFEYRIFELSKFQNFKISNFEF